MGFKPIAMNADKHNPAIRTFPTSGLKNKINPKQKSKSDPDSYWDEHSKSKITCHLQQKLIRI